MSILIKNVRLTDDLGYGDEHVNVLVENKRIAKITRDDIAADTIVVCEEKVLGKPRSEEEAVQMLTLLSGRDHQVMTGMTVVRGQNILSCTEVTDIHFRELSQKEIAAYVATGEPMDKAGAYGIQGGAALFAEKMVGDYYNVMGLPVCKLRQLLAEVAPELF